MRRVSLVCPLALFLLPAAALAQSTAPAEPPPSESTAATPESSSGDTTTDAAAVPPPVESTPVLPPATEDRAATTAAAQTTPHPVPAPADLESRTTPILELHGYLRSRFELFQDFSLGWAQQTAAPRTRPDAQYNSSHLLWPRNPDYSSRWCGPDTGSATGGAITPVADSCGGGTQTSANMRLRLNPEIHPTEWIAIHSQIDLLDNLVLGSTPNGYYSGGTPWAPITALSETQLPPTAGFNSLANSIVVKRAWAEVSNQTLGQIRFGRMPNHWGLGMLYNAGNGYDSDFQSTVDRVMYSARIRSLGLFAAAMYDFQSVGPTSAGLPINENGNGQLTDLSFLDDVRQGSIALGRRMEPEQQSAALARGEVVVNGGLYFTYRQQFLSYENIAGTDVLTRCLGDGANLGNAACGTSGQRRDASIFTPDLWLQVLGRDFRFEAEAAYNYGNIASVPSASGDDSFRRLQMHQFGGALEGEYRLLQNRLKIEFKTGYASGDPDTEGFTNGDQLAAASSGGSRTQTLSLFSFHPDYRIDLILWRRIMQRMAGAYYFRPSVSYNFIDEPNGELFFGRVDVIWSRASEFISTRGNHADLGVEFDATLQYQSNHRRVDSGDRRPMPGFYAMLQYGILLPMAGLGPTDNEKATGGPYAGFSLSTAQTLRGYLGVMF